MPLIRASGLPGKRELPIRAGITERTEDMLDYFFRMILICELRLFSARKDWKESSKETGREDKNEWVWGLDFSR